MCTVGIFWHFDLENWNYELDLDIFYQLLLRNYKCQQLHIYRHINLTWNLCIAKSLRAFDCWPWYNHHHDNFVRHIAQLRNYTCQLFHIFRTHQSYIEHVHCRDILTFWPLSLWPWYYELHLDKIVWAIAQKLYMATASYCQGIAI